VTQSAASQIVSQLEKLMGLRLINRSTRPLQLTEPGKVYYEGCKRLVSEYHDLEASVRQAQAQLDGNVEVAAIYSVGLGDMGQYVERFKTLYPDTTVHIDYLHPDRVYEKVLGETADFGLVSFPKKSRDLTSRPWRDEEMIVACSPRHPLAQNVAVEPAQLQGVRYVGFNRDLTIRREVDRFLREQGVNVEVEHEFDNIENIKQAVELGTGVALLPEPTLRREVQAGTLVALPLFGCRLVRPLGIIQRRHHRLSTAAARFLDLLCTGETQESQPLGLQSEEPKDHLGRNGHNGRSRKARPTERTV